MEKKILATVGEKEITNLDVEECFKKLRSISSYAFPN